MNPSAARLTGKPQEVEVIDVPFVERIETVAKQRPLRAMMFAAFAAAIVAVFATLFYTNSLRDQVSSLENEVFEAAAKNARLVTENLKLGNQLKETATLRRDLADEIKRKRELAVLYEREKAARKQAERDHAAALEQIKRLSARLPPKKK